MPSLVKTIKERGSSRKFERSFLASTTSGTYRDEIIIFMLWLFDIRGGFLVQEYVPEFEATKHEYLLDFQQREEDGNLTNRRKRNPINKRTGVRKLRRQIVDAIHPSRSGISHISLIKIYGEGGITYRVVRYYMASKINVSYVEKDSAEENLISIRSDGIITADMVDSNGKVKCMVRQSSSRYGGIRSASNHVYISARVQIPEIMKREISTFIVGTERTVIAEKHMIGINIYKGKNPISLEVFDILANTLF